MYLITEELGDEGLFLDIGSLRAHRTKSVRCRAVAFLMAEPCECRQLAQVIRDHVEHRRTSPFGPSAGLLRHSAKPLTIVFARCYVIKESFPFSSENRRHSLTALSALRPSQDGRASGNGCRQRQAIGPAPTPCTRGVPDSRTASS